MKILSLSIGHDASYCILQDGEILSYNSEERFSRRKHDEHLECVLNYLIEEGDINFDTVCIYHYDDIGHRQYITHLIEVLNDNFNFGSLKVDCTEHHLLHAYGAFYHSGFEEAICIPIDSAGAYNNTLLPGSSLNCQESESIFYFQKNKQPEILHKKYIQKEFESFSGKYVRQYFNDPDNSRVSMGLPSDTECPECVEKDFGTYKVVADRLPSIGILFDDCERKHNLQWCSAGKLMGLAQYKGNEQELEQPWSDIFDDAYKTQQNAHKASKELIEKALRLKDSKNIVISGGVGLNCVLNYQHLEDFSDRNIYLDPICFDAGISIGGAYKEYLSLPEHFCKKDIPELKTVYLGQESEYNLNGFVDATYEDVVDILLQQNVVALFQGKSEAGQRSLGNRTLLFDPRNKNGKDIVNTIKKREAFRPFAGTILKEHVHEWFDLRGMDESPYMMYAADVLKDDIPAVTHIDKTCRLQTVTKDQNLHFYNIIDCFYQKTNVPVLLNTSFNLAGDPLVQSFDDAIHTMNNSAIKYLYLPEVGKILRKD